MPIEFPERAWVSETGERAVETAKDAPKPSKHVGGLFDPRERSAGQVGDQPHSVPLARGSLRVTEPASIDERHHARQRQRRVDGLHMAQQRRLERHRARWLGGIHDLQRELAVSGAHVEVLVALAVEWPQLAVDAKLREQQGTGRGL